MQRICSWLSNESYRFFDGVARFEIMSRTSGRLSRTLTRAQHWIRHIFSHRTPTIDWNKPSYAQDSVRFLEIIKSRIHQQTVQICSRKGAKLYYDKMIALWYRTEPIYIYRRVCESEGQNLDVPYQNCSHAPKNMKFREHAYQHIN